MFNNNESSFDCHRVGLINASERKKIKKVTFVDETSVFKYQCITLQKIDKCCLTKG